MEIKGKIFGSFLVLASLILVGVIGYSYFLNIGLIDAIYMTIITISTVGFQEVTQMNQSAKVFSIILILFSIGTVSYLVTNIASYFVEGDLKEALKRRKMENKLANMSDHHIICGAGKTGQAIIDVFVKRGVDFVVIDEKEEVVNKLVEHNIIALHGNATEEDVLIKANISKAKGLVTALSKDSLNLYVVLTAKTLNPNLNIVTKAVDKRAHHKLMKAGAHNTISPNEIAGRRMAVSLLRPTVISFLDSFIHTGDVDLDLEDVIIDETSELCNLTLKDANIPTKTGLIILAISKKGDNDLRFNPNSNEMLEAGDAMIVLGQEEQINALQRIAKDKRNY